MFLPSQSDLISYHTETFVKTEVVCTVMKRPEINVLLDTCIYLITAVWSGAYFVSIFEQILDSALF